MATQQEVVIWIIVFVILIEGVWLTGLTYLIWKRAKKRRERSKPEREEE